MNGFGRGEDRSPDKKKILTKETVGMTMLLFSVVALIILATGPIIFGEVGTAITAFFVGAAGFYIYPVFVLLILASISLIAGKRVIPVRWLLRPMLLVTAVFFIVHTATDGRFFYDASSQTVGYGTYLTGCWNAAAEHLSGGTGGGVLFGLIGYPVRLLLSEAGAYVLYSVLVLAALAYFLFLTPVRNLFVKPSAGKLPARTGDDGKRLPPDDRPVPAETPRSVLYPGASAHPAPAAAGMASVRTPAQSAFPPQASVRTNAQPASPAASAAAAAPAPTPSEQENQRRSRDILFGGTAAERYRKNLIFDQNSAFNTRPRSTTLRPDAGSAPSEPASSARPANPYTPVGPTPYTPAPGYTPTPYTPAPGYTPPEEPYTPRSDAGAGYSKSYSDEAEQTRPSMPRKTRSVGRDYPEEDGALGYPAPAYRSPLSDPPADPYRSERFRETPPEPPRIDDPADSRPAPPAPVRRDFTADTGRDLSRDTGRDLSRDTGRDLGRDTGREGTRASDLFDDTRSPDRDVLFGSSRDASLSDRDDDFAPQELDDGPDDDNGYDPFGGGKPDSPASIFDDVEPRSARGLRDVEQARESYPEPPAEPTPPPAPEPAPAPAPAPAPEPKKKKRHIWKKYRRPSLDLLDDYEDRPHLSNEEIGRNSGIILDTLRRYRIETRVKKVVGGASVTRYDLDMPEGATINMVTKYSGELAVFLNVKGVNMYANPEVGGISVEVPNENRVTVGLKNLLQSEAFCDPDREALTFALGQDIEGRWVCGDITKMTHILVAGQTGSGKSISIHAMLVSMLYKYSPEDLRLILIDPKQTEFTIYEGLPHLMINEIIVDAPKAISALNWAIKEMERRYALFNEKTRSGIAVRKIDEYNAVRTEDEDKLPKIVIVVDEFGDLMLVAKKDLEERIRRLTQKARAAGIHIVLATQRPSAEVVTGVIKSNLPTRISLLVDSELNSRIILDEGGAEKLLGYGDMLVKTSGKPRRVQGAYIGPRETQDVVNYIKENNEAYFDDEALDYIERAGGGDADVIAGEGGEGGTGGADGPVTEQHIRALAMVVRRGQASISLIQRSCGVGYNHAGKIIEWMEAKGYISPFDGKAKARSVLLTKEEYEQLYGPLD